MSSRVMIYLRRVLNRKTQFLQIAPKILDSLIVALNGVRGELAELVGESFGLGHLARSQAGSLLVEDVLQLHREDLAVLIELLCADIRHRVTGEQRQLLKRILVVFVVEQLENRTVALTDQLDENLLPESLPRDLLLVRLTQLHLPTLAVVSHPREVLERLADVLVEQRSRRRFLGMFLFHVEYKCHCQVSCN